MKTRASFKAEFNPDCDLKKSLEELSDFMVKDFQEKFGYEKKFRVIIKREKDDSNAIVPGSLCYRGVIQEL